MDSQDYFKFHFIKYDYNSKDSHQVDVDPKEEELGVLEGDSANILHSYHFGKNKCNQLLHLAIVQGVTNPLVGKTRDKVI